MKWIFDLSGNRRKKDFFTEVSENIPHFNVVNSAFKNLQGLVQEFRTVNPKYTVCLAISHRGLVAAISEGWSMPTTFWRLLNDIYEFHARRWSVGNTI